MIIYILAAIVVLILVGAILTNPFSRLSIVRKPYVVKLKGQQIVGLERKHRIIVRNNPWWIVFAWVKSGFHVMETRYVHSPRSSGRSVQEITKDIHKLRYDPQKLLLISGDHFNALYVRNLGVFYYPLLDSHIVSSSEDWLNRQIVYLETVAFALGVFDKFKRLTTTIVSTAAHGVTCTNFYAYPSDSLYGMLYALAVLSGKQVPQPYSYKAKTHYNLTTQAAASSLLEQRRSLLQTLYAQYLATVYDEQDGLIKTSIHLSGAKDITRRVSSFYDNVIFWKTTQLAMELELIPMDRTFLANLKKRILKTFWLKESGYFLEDLSDDGRRERYYSSDWLSVLFTGFLDPRKKSEQPYYVSALKYIDEQGIDRPFALKYQQETRAERQFLPVRIAVASYGGDAIWSFWGMEYIKVLLVLYEATGKKHYLKKADYHIDRYKANMRRDGGFPEVYDSQGRLLQTALYRSIRQTGWVIGFEQVLVIRDRQL